MKLSKTDYKFINKWAKKLRATRILGGKCIKCGESNLLKLEFHHNNGEEKENRLSTMFDKRWSAIAYELSKCSLLCKNCHKEVHFEIAIRDSKWRINKNIFLEYKGSTECSECGYDKCQHALDFHHIIDDKKFIISQVTIRIYNVGDLPIDIQNEIDKCIILCRNCHSMKHVNMEKYAAFKDKIEDVSYSFTELQAKIDRDKIYELKVNGYKNSDIAKELKCSKSTITYALKTVPTYGVRFLT